MNSAGGRGGYNERLFSGGIRRHLHLARFKWLANAVTRHAGSYKSVLELGCFDGKAIEFLPKMPTRYVGFDANWEGGLDVARERWRSCPTYRFEFATGPDDMKLAGSDRYDLAIVMETLEHVPPGMVDGYLRKISAHLDGPAFITVPNEKGVVFLAKYLAKRVFSMDPDPYRPAEVLNATFGRMSKVARREHKGFDYAELIRVVERHFQVDEVSGIPYGKTLPPSLCFGVGIVARPIPSHP